jgi:hypothetical protein
MAVRNYLDNVNRPPNRPINRSHWDHPKGGTFITDCTRLMLTLRHLHILHSRISCSRFKHSDLNPNIWRPPCFKPTKPPLRCHQEELASVSHDCETKPHYNHPHKPCHISSKVMRLLASLKSSYNMQPMTPIPPSEPHAQDKTSEAPHTNHLCGCLH